MSHNIIHTVITGPIGRLKGRYDTAWKDWKASPRYKKASEKMDRVNWNP